VGYELDECDATVLAVLEDAIVLDRTPFYAESGGQCGDQGFMGETFVDTVTKTPEGVFLHHCNEIPNARPGDVVHAKIMDRRDIRANHTAAHLLHAALRKVLGNHVEQAGQSVTPNSVRFDFTHFTALTQKELGEVEFAVNAAIRAAIPVETEVLPIEEAKARGAMALFGEKYGDTVRMVKIGDASTELCGGTHAANTGNLGMLLVTGESGIASGVRRIEAVTAENAFWLAHERQDTLKTVAAALKANNVGELESRAEAVMAQLKEAEKSLAAAQAKLSGYAVQELLRKAKQVGAVRFVPGEVESDPRRACDIARESDGAVAALFVCKTDKGALQFAAACSPAAVKAGAHAGDIAKAAARAAGGSGGGKPDSAMAGGKDPSKLGEALAAGEAALAAMLKL
jgi:alanyl-tRNA synthetase